MRALAATTLPLLALSASTSTSSAQQKVSALNGVWHQVDVRVVRPDSAYTRPPATGVRMYFDGHFVNLQIDAVPAGVQQSASPTTAEAKAARYDLLTANAGTFEIRDTTFVDRYEFAKDPARIGQTSTNYFRLRGDTLWRTTVTPWSKDSTKTVRLFVKWVREKSRQ